MKRKLEKRLLQIGAVWNLLNGALTLFVYSPWVKNELLGELNGRTTGLNYLSENLNIFVMTYGLLFLFFGILHLYLSGKLANQVLMKLPIWLLLFGLLSYFMVDIIGAVLYLSAGVISLSKNKALKPKTS